MDTNDSSDISALRERFGGRPPSVRAESCLNVRHRHAGCSRCEDVCPNSAIDLDHQGPRLFPDLCIHCGACATMCPTDVFGQSNPPEHTLALTLAQLPPTAPLELVCPLSGGAKTQAPVAARVRHRRCLAALTPLALLELSRDGVRPIWLDDSPCATCPLAPAQTVIRQAAATANGLLAALGLAPALALYSQNQDRLLPEPIQRPMLDGMQPKVSRRGFFSALRKMAQDRVEQALEEEPPPMLRTAAPVDQRLPHQTPPSRKRLLAHLAQLTASLAEHPIQAGGEEQAIPLADLPFAAVQVDPGACSGCGLCARFCPTGALAFQGDVLGLHGPEDAPEPFSLGFRAALCLDCGICAAACPEGAITFGDSLPGSVLLAQDWTPLVEGELVACVECGAPTAAQAEGPARCYVCRQHVGRAQPLRDDAALFIDLLRRLPPHE